MNLPVSLTRPMFLLSILLFTANTLASEKIVFWSAHQHAEYLNTIIDKFQKDNDIEIELHHFLAPKLREELILQAKNNRSPDILYVPGDFVGMHKVLNLSPVPDDWMLEQLDLRVRETGKVSGQYYGVPLFQGNHLMMFYNRELIKKSATSWQELYEQLSALPKDMKEPLAWSYGEMFWLIPFMSAFDAWPLKGDTITLDTPEMAKTLSFYKKFADDKLISVRCSHDCSVDKFKSGKAAYMINGDWIINDLNKSMGDTLGIAVLPKVGNKLMLPMFSSYVLAYPDLSKSGKNLAIIKKFTQFVQGTWAQQVVRDEGALLPVNSDVLAQKQELRSENQKAVIAQMQQTKTMPTSPNMTIAWLAMSKGFSRFMRHNYTSEKAAQLMQQVADKELKRQQSEAK